MTIRRARRDEAAALTALAIRAKASWGYSPQALAGWRDALTITPRKIERQPVWVREAPDGTVIGFHALRKLDDGSGWELDDLWVAPAWQRRGIGTALLRHALEQAGALGARALSIDADPLAEPFYVRCGAVRTGACPAPIPEDPARVRPQLRIDLAVRAAAASA